MKEKDSPLIRQDWKLIRQYVNKGSQTAFAELSARYVNMVYTICLRETRQPQLAEDAAQAVFLVFAQKCKTFRPGIILSTWLFAVCRLTCRNALRAQRRQAKWEEKAAQDMLTQNSTETERWREIEPHLDDAIASLNHRERDLILLRFFEDQSLEEVGQTLGLSPDAARMGVNRAVEKLRQQLVKHGAQVAGVTLAALLAAHSVQAAPADFASNALVQSATAGATAGTSVHVLAKGVLKTMSIIKSTIIATALAGVAGVSLVAIIGAHALRPVTPEQLVAAAPTKSDPKALAILQQMADAYAKLTSYSDTETSKGDQMFSIPQMLKINYRKPGEFEFETTRDGTTTRSVADKQFVYLVQVPPAKTYTRRPLEKSEPPIFSVMNASDLKPGIEAVPMILYDPTDFAARVIKNPKAIIYLGDSETIRGDKCDTVIMAYLDGHGGDMGIGILSIGHLDHLLRRTREITPRQGQTPTTDDEIDVTDLHANPILADSIFQFVPEQGANSIDIGMHGDPKANTVMQAMYDTYNALHSFSCTEDVSFIPGKVHGYVPPGPWIIAHSTYIVQKPYSVSFNIQDMESSPKSELRIVSDGHTAFVQGTGPSWNAAQYVQQSLIDTKYNNKAELINFARNTSNSTDWIPAMPLEWDMRPADPNNDYDFTLEKPISLNGETVDVVFVPSMNTNPTPKQASEHLGERLYIGQNDHLLRQVDEISDNPDGGMNLMKHIFGNIQTNPNIDKSNFIFTPAPGSKSVSDLIALRRR